MLLLTGISFIIPFYLEFSLGLTTDLAGLVMTVPALLLIGAGPLAAVLSGRIGLVRLCLLGAGFFVAVYLLLFPLDAETRLVYVVVVLLLSGLAAGLFIPINYQLILGFAAPADIGVIGSTAITMRNIGSAFAMALYAGVFAIAVHASDVIGDHGPRPHLPRRGPGAGVQRGLPRRDRDRPPADGDHAGRQISSGRRRAGAAARRPGRVGPGDPREGFTDPPSIWTHA